MYSAMMELLSGMNVMHSVAAGNYRGTDLRSTNFSYLGELNSLGSRFYADGTSYQQPGLFLAGAYDGFARDRLAEFSSAQDPLRPEDTVHFSSFPGVHIMLPVWTKNGWQLRPMNGTSFAAPHQTQILHRAREIVAQEGLFPLTNQQWQKLVARSSIPLPDRGENEGGLRFDEPRFWRELEKEIIMQRVMLAFKMSH